MPEEAGQGEQQRAGGEGDAGDGGYGWWVGASKNGPYPLGYAVTPYESEGDQYHGWWADDEQVLGNTLFGDN